MSKRGGKVVLGDLLSMIKDGFRWRDAETPTGQPSRNRANDGIEDSMGTVVSTTNERFHTLSHEVGHLSITDVM